MPGSKRKKANHGQPSQDDDIHRGQAESAMEVEDGEGQAAAAATTAQAVDSSTRRREENDDDDVDNAER